jgi:hypothetical protein
MPTILSQVQAPTIATSMMASLYGAVRTWDDLTLTDLFGYSGHAFILNIERTLCPSGPTAWDWGAILFPLRQMYTLRRLCASCDMRSTDEARELIWQRTVESIDESRPVILWDALLPEFYLANGYDAERGDFLVQGPGASRTAGRAAMSHLGLRTGQVWALFPGPHDGANRTAARDLALRGAVTWHRWPGDPTSQWTFGGEAWNVWIAAMTDEEPAHDAKAIALNHAVYAECRRHAADFLAAQGPAFAPAAAAYRRVADALDAVCAAWPLTAPLPELETRRALAGHLEAARDAEADGVAAVDAVLTAGKLTAA